MSAGNNRRRVLCLLALAGAFSVLGGPAAGREGGPSREALTTLGTLTCSLSDGADASQTAQVRDIVCRFRAGSLGSEEIYAGTMQSLGQAEALFGRGTVMLEVRGAATVVVAPGLLQQAYAADASAAVSAATPLIGETNPAIVLQPLTREEGRVAAGRIRPEAAIIMVELKLESTAA
jgi:hypothetical protein